MSRKQKPLFLFVMLFAALLTFTAVFAADNPTSTIVDATLDYVPEMYVPTAADLAYTGITAGDVAEGDIQAVGTSLQYTGLVLNGDGVNPNAAHPFLKVQQQSATGSFEYAACYLGNNSNAGSFGLGFFALSQPFNNAHMRASRVDNTVTIEFTNVNGGALPNQTYVCNGAPAPPGGNIGTLGYANIAKIDNFSDGSTVLDTFSYTGPLGATGNWNDAAPGMNADGSRASGGPLALAFWVGQVGCPPKFVDVSLAQQVNGNLRVDFSTGNVAQKLTIVVIASNGLPTIIGPFNNLPANWCQTLQLPMQVQNPPHFLVMGVLRDQQGNGNVIYDVLFAPPAPPPNTEQVP